MTLNDWFVPPGTINHLLPMEHNHGIVLLSVLIAILISAMALQIAGVARLSRTRSIRHLAIATGALAMGGGIWAMHFIAMLAMKIPVQFHYDPLLTLLSMLPGLAAAWIALALLAQRAPGRVKLLTSGLLMGAGIGLMHYSGMAAIVMQPALRYDPVMFVVSLVVAVLLANLALWVRFGLRGRVSSITAILAGGAVMGIAISSMHYTGMAAARIIGYAEFDTPQAMQDSRYLAGMIAMGTLSFSILVAAVNSLLRYHYLHGQHLVSQRRMEAILDTAIDGVIIIDEVGTIRNVNASMSRLFGWAEHELLQQNVRKLMPEPHQSNHDGYLSAYKQHGQAKIIGVGREVMALHKDGHEFPIRLAIGRTELPGEVLYTGIISDISERKQMEEALRESEQNYRSLISNIPGVAFRCLIDERWSMLFISDAVEKLLGYPADDFISGRRNIVDCYHPDDRAPLTQTVEQAIQRGTHYSVEYRLIDRQGQEHWVLESGNVVTDDNGQPKWLDGVLLDQTESKLRNAEYQSKMTAISKAVLLIELDLDKTILAVNDNFLDCLGYRREEIIGQSHPLLCSGAEVNSPAYSEFWQALQRGEFHAGEFCRYDKQGNEVWLQATYNPILDANGVPVKVLKLAIDITHRRHMEEELRTARDRAEQAAAARSLFLANMSHEIRTPMNAIIGFTELLLDSPLNEQQQRQLKTVHQSSSSLLGLLNDILDTAKLDKGAVELEKLDFSLAELCRQVCDNHQLSAHKKGLILSFEYAPELPEYFRGDPLRLRQILNNLIGNAIKFTERGQVQLQVSGRSGAVRFDIRDTGIGIPADRLHSIFDPFSQADASMSRRFGGTGLGTTISRQLVELMRGSIRVTSTEGQGSTFSVELPLPATQQPLKATPANALPALPPLRILIADDVPQNLELLQLNLEKMGHQIITASDGASAVAAYRQQQPDLIIMDVQMPGMDGLEASRMIQALAQSDHNRKIPIIALTASVLDRDRQEAQAAGMQGFASKPLDMQALTHEMARLLNLQPATAPNQQPLPQTLPVIDWQRGLALWGDKNSLIQRIQNFLLQQHELANALQNAVTQAAWQQARALCHKARGVAGNLGLSQLHQQLTLLEQAAINENDAEFNAALPNLSHALTAIKPALPTPEAAPDKTVIRVDQSTLRQHCATLEEALQHSAIDRHTQQYLQEIATYFPQEAEQLQQEIDDFNFENAIRLLHNLSHRLQGD